MLAQNGTAHNGIQITPADTQGPKWRDAFPRFTHNLSWQDADGYTHSMTLCADDLQDLLADLKLIKAGIRQTKAKASETVPQPPQQAKTHPDVLRCEIHGINMERRWSKRTGDAYFSHRLGDCSLCYGKPK